MSASATSEALQSRNEVVISVDQLRHSYDGKKFALNGVTFEVRRGEVFGLLGRNGAGKSTLIKAMTTLVQPTSGTLRILGMDPVRKGQQIRRRIGVVQQGESFDFTTVEGNLDVYGVLWGIPRAETIRRRERLLTRFGIEDIRKRRSFDLSGGQKRRVQVAREFLHDMDLLFLDEPTVGLDVIMRRTLLDTIREEVRQGLTVVFTTHNLEEADYLCDRVAVIDEGRLLVLDTLENLKRLYGGKRTLEITVAPDEATRFFPSLRERLGARAEVTVDAGSATILTDDVKMALGQIVDLSQSMGVHLEWLNIRKNTLEDVFLRSVGHGGEAIGTAYLLRLVYRNIKVNTDPGTLIILVGLPGLYLVFFGFGFGALTGGSGYLAFLTPGIMSFQAVIAGLVAGGMLWADRRYGMLAQLLVGPFTRLQYLLGLMFTAVIFGLAGAVVMLGIAYGLIGSGPALGLFFLSMFGIITLGSIFFGSLMLLIAALVRSNTAYNSIQVLVIFVVNFASTVFYPLSSSLPLALEYLFWANPLTYIANAVRGAYGGSLTATDGYGLIVLTAETVVVLSLSVRAYLRSDVSME